MDKALLATCIFLLSIWFVEVDCSTTQTYTSSEVQSRPEAIQLYETAEEKILKEPILGYAEDAVEGRYNIPATEYASYQMYIDDHPELVESHTFKITHYCGCSRCCGKYSSGSESDAYGCKGDKMIPKYSIATDPSIIPYGTELWDDEGNHYVAADTGSGVRGYHIDLFVGNHKGAINLGVQYRTLYWVEEDNNG